MTGMTVERVLLAEPRGFCAGVDMEALQAIGGGGTFAPSGKPQTFPLTIAKPILALCSGLLDAMNGQILQVDKGMAFADTLSQKLENREELGL